MIVAFAARTGREVVFQRHGRAHRGDGGIDGDLGQHGAAEVGVQHRPGQIDDRAHRGHVGGLQARQRGGSDPLRARRGR